MKGHLFILSSPSGGGKTSIGKALVRRLPRLIRSVSVTTRRPRPGEKRKRDYFFVSKSAFETMKRRRELLEWTTYDGHAYGTPRLPVEEELASGRDILLLLDVHGALALKRRLKKATTIFVLPPSFRDLMARLSRRKTEGHQDISRRMKIAKKELTYAPQYDYVVVNDQLTKAIAAIERIVRLTRSRKRP